MKIVLADSNELMRIGLRAILNSKDGVEIVAETKSSKDLLSICNNFQFDEIVIDYTSSGFSIDVVPKILQRKPEINIIAFTFEQSATTLVNALKSGIKSYVKKDCGVAEILEGITETGRGNHFFCGEVMQVIKKSNIDVDDLSSEPLAHEEIQLSDREKEIIQLIAEGLTNTQIAEQLFLSSHTVNTHRKNIMAKLGVKNTAGIVMYAVKTNIVSPNKFLFASGN